KASDLALGEGIERVSHLREAEADVARLLLLQQTRWLELQVADSRQKQKRQSQVHRRHEAAEEPGASEAEMRRRLLALLLDQQIEEVDDLSAHVGLDPSQREPVVEGGPHVGVGGGRADVAIEHRLVADGREALPPVGARDVWLVVAGAEEAGDRLQIALAAADAAAADVDPAGAVEAAADGVEVAP